MNLQSLRKNLKKLLKEEKMTLNTLSIRADLSEDTLRSLIYSNAKDVKMSTIIKIATVFNCSIDSLLGHSVYSSHEEYIIQKLRTLSDRSRQTILALIDLEEQTTLHSSYAGKDFITVFLPTGNLIDGQFYDTSFFETLDISAYPNSLKNTIDFGLKILSDNFQPIYDKNDILLLSRRQIPEHNDIVLYLDQDGKIFLRRYTTIGLEPLSRSGSIIPPNRIYQYSSIGVVVKVVKEFNIEQYR